MSKPLDRLKIANPYYPPPGYGQYGEPRDDSSGLNTALAVGGAGLLGAGLHHGLMNSRGQFAQAYQNNLGRSIRDAANTARGHLGMEAVAQPPHPLLGRAQDALGAVRGGLSNAGDMYNKLKGPAMAAVGMGTTAVGAHQRLMGDNSRLGEVYRRIIGDRVQGGVNAVKTKVKARASATAPAQAAAPVAPPKDPRQGELDLNPAKGQAEMFPAAAVKSEKPPSPKPEPRGAEVTAKRTGPAIDTSPKKTVKPMMKKSSLEDHLIRR